MIWILGVLLGYIFGSIPSAVWFGKWWHKIDVREHGSGNAGATNVFRVLGKKTGIVVLLVDIGKGAFSASIPSILVSLNLIEYHNDTLVLNAGLAAGLAAILGHLYPVFADFKGGKGVATMLGVMLAIQTIPTLICAAVFLVIWLSFKYISLASMSGGITFPIVYFLMSDMRTIPMDIVAIVLPLLLIYTHRSNIKKLRNGTENKMSPFKAKKNEV